MVVRKRSGELQEYFSEKIKYSIERASDETNMPVTSRDLDLIFKEVDKRLKDKKRETVTSDEILDEVIVVLMRNRFYRIAEKYSEGADK